MKHEKSPQLRARLLRGYRSDYRTIANLNAKNNTPDHPIKNKRYIQAAPYSGA